MPTLRPQAADRSFSNQHRLLGLVLTLLLFCSWRSAWSQELLVKHFDVEQGLPSSTVYRMLVDPYGFLWLATATGVHRYDGSRFEHIGAGSDLDHLVVHHIFATSPDTLWFAVTNGRLFRWDGQRLVEAVALRIRASNNIVDPRIVSLIDDRNGGVRFGYPAVMGAGRIDRHLRATWDTSMAPGTYVELAASGPMLYHSSKGRALADQQYPLHFISEDTAYTVPIGPLTLGGTSPRNFVLQRSDGLLMAVLGTRIVAFRNSGPYVFHASDRTILRLHFTADSHSIVVHEDGTAVVLDRDGQRTSLSLRTLHRWRISDVTSDHQGGLWISTLGGGLFYAPSFDCTRPLAIGELESGGITAMHVHPNGTTWLGTNLGECLVIGSDDERKFTWNLPLNGRLREIRAFLFDPYDQRMLASTPGGFVEFTAHTHRMLHPSDRNSWFGHALVMVGPDDALLLSSRGVARVGLVEGGESRWMRLGERFSGGMRGEGDTLWVWSQDGLRWCLEGEVHDYRPDEPLLRTPVLDRSVCGGAVWLATSRHGLLCLRNTSEPKVVDLGVTDVRATCLQPIGDSLLIVGSVQGLFRVDLRDPEGPVARIDRNWGLPSEIIRSIRFDGVRLRVLTEQGLISVAPGAFDRTPPAQPVRILSATLGDGRVLFNGMELQHDIDRITLRFCHLNYRDHGHQLFRYTVSGLSEAATETREPEVNLLGLPPGNYRFSVSGREPDGSWTEPQSLAWTIAPAIWQTWWFTALASVVGAMVFGLIAAWFFRLRTKRAELEEAVLTHHQEALLAQMDPHFIFNSLNSVQSFIARNESDRSLRYMGRFSKLMRGLLQAGREREITLQQEIDLLDQYCSLEALRFEPPFTFRIIANDLPKGVLLVPAYLIQPHVENAIRHGLWGLTARQGHLDVVFTNEDGELRCMVTDNGIGRAAAYALPRAANDRPEALKIQQERIEALNRLSRKGGIRVHVEDLIDVNGSPNGTRVHIAIPWRERPEPNTDDTDGNRN